MNNTERDMRVTQLEKRVTHLAQDSSSAWASLENLSRQLVVLRHRVHVLEQDIRTIREDTNK